MVVRGAPAIGITAAYGMAMAQKNGESMEDKIDFINKVFMEPLFNQVFFFIDEKKRLDSKRKTWNLKHQET